ncbi:MAG: hypothetical protein HY505_00335 [Candidatus Yanofskybacteria bacterium]|nr:hypothetical protein [Candidatus Yanofskybacteria bacterium]
MKFLSKNLIFPFFLFFISASWANAARVYFEPQLTSYRVGDSFSVAIFLDTEGEEVNAVEFVLSIPQLLKINDISKTGSVIKLWVNEPSYSGEIASMTGGIPGGLTTSGGLVARLYLQAAAIGKGNIALAPGSSVFLNDGQGTKLELSSVGGPVFEIAPRPKGEEPTRAPEPEISEPSIKSKAPPELIEDNKKPEKFEIFFGKDPRVFGGEDFISFFTTDAESGVDHYEAKLGKGPFNVAKAPYLIKDLEPRTVIRVRAYDAADNYRESVWPGFFRRLWWSILNIFI